MASKMASLSPPKISFTSTQMQIYNNELQSVFSKFKLHHELTMDSTLSSETEDLVGHVLARKYQSKVVWIPMKLVDAVMDSSLLKQNQIPNSRSKFNIITKSLNLNLGDIPKLEKDTLFLFETGSSEHSVAGAAMLTKESSFEFEYHTFDSNKSNDVRDALYKATAETILSICYYAHNTTGDPRFIEKPKAGCKYDDEGTNINTRIGFCDYSGANNCVIYSIIWWIGISEYFKKNGIIHPSILWDENKTEGYIPFLGRIIIFELLRSGDVPNCKLINGEWNFLNQLTNPYDLTYFVSYTNEVKDWLVENITCTMKNVSAHTVFNVPLYPQYEMDIFDIIDNFWSVKNSCIDTMMNLCKYNFSQFLDRQNIDPKFDEHFNCKVFPIIYFPSYGDIDRLVDTLLDDPKVFVVPTDYMVWNAAIFPYMMNTGEIHFVIKISEWEYKKRYLKPNQYYSTNQIDEYIAQPKFILLTTGYNPDDGKLILKHAKARFWRSFIKASRNTTTTRGPDQYYELSEIENYLDPNSQPPYFGNAIAVKEYLGKYKDEIIRMVPNKEIVNAYENRLILFYVLCHFPNSIIVEDFNRHLVGETKIYNGILVTDRLYDYKKFYKVIIKVGMQGIMAVIYYLMLDFKVELPFNSKSKEAVVRFAVRKSKKNIP